MIITHVTNKSDNLIKYFPFSKMELDLFNNDNTEIIEMNWPRNRTLNGYNVMNVTVYMQTS